MKNEEQFELLTKQLIEWLNKNGHPHMTIIINCNSAELLEGIKCINK